MKVLYHSLTMSSSCVVSKLILRRQVPGAARHYHPTFCQEQRPSISLLTNRACSSSIAASAMDYVVLCKPPQTLKRQLHVSSKLKEIYVISTEDDFEQKVMRSSVPVVVNFHAEWCEPCHALKPLLESLALKFKGRFHLAEVKVDDHVALLHAFEVTAVPAVLGVVSGQVKEKFVGLISEAEVKAFVNTMIGE